MLLAFGDFPSDELANVFELGGGPGLRNRPSRLHGASQLASSFPSVLFLHHLPDSEIYLIKYLGITTLYLNSIILKSRKIDVFPTGSTIRGDKVGPIYYSDIVGKFLSDESQQKITFSADHIFYHFKSGRAGLQNVNIAEKGGKLIGLMAMTSSASISSVVGKRPSAFLENFSSPSTAISNTPPLERMNLTSG